MRAAVVTAVALLLDQTRRVSQGPDRSRGAVRFEDIDPAQPLLGTRMLFSVPSGTADPLPDVEVELVEKEKCLMIRVEGKTYDFADRSHGDIGVARTARRDGADLCVQHTLGTGKSNAASVGQAAHMIRLQSGDQSGVVTAEVSGSFQFRFCKASTGSFSVQLRRRTDMDEEA